MLLALLAQITGPADRVKAVHEHFAGRTSADGIQVVFGVLVMAVLLCGVLVLLNRIQQQRRRRVEAEHARRRRQLTAPRDQFMTLGQRRTTAGRT